MGIVQSWYVGTMVRKLIVFMVSAKGSPDKNAEDFIVKV